MRATILTILTAAGLAAGVTSASAFFGGGGNGGDREPAGGAFMSSYPERGSTGVPPGGPPRSVDIPRDYYGRPIGRVPGGYRYYGYGPGYGYGR